MIEQRIEVEISGGIGNQLFQYAAALSLSRRFRARLVIDLSWFNKKSRHSSTRIFQLPEFVEVRNLDVTSSVLHPFARRANCYIRRQTQLRDSQVSPEEFHSITTQRSIRMRGYWQSERYFTSVKSMLRDMLLEKRIVATEAALWMKSVGLIDSVGIHVRRGDYVSNRRTNKFHGVCDSTYFEKGLEYVQALRSVRRAIVFSDDIEWCKRNLQLNAELVFMDQSISDADQLKLMSFCSHHVISNSTFSWWAAWLGHTNGQVVVYPKRWFADGGKLESMPQGWHPV
jgi:hypothetical protein